MTNGEYILSLIPKGKATIDYIGTRDNPIYTVFFVEHEWWQSQKDKPKSLTMNSYMWVLCDRLAKAKTNREHVIYTKEDIYRHAVREVGVFDDTNAIRSDALDEYMEKWSGRGVGWFCETHGVVFYDIYGNEYQPIRQYYGSRTYNSAELRRLVDYIVEAAKEEGIQTATPDELAHLESLWRSNNG